MRLRNRRGANAIEFALTAPILFTMIFGVFETGWFFCHQAVLDDITSEVARTVSYSAADTIDVYFDTAEQLAIDKWETALPGTPTFSYQIVQNGNLPSVVTVTATVSYRQIGPLDLLRTDQVTSTTMTSWQGEWQ